MQVAQACLFLIDPYELTGLSSYGSNIAYIKFIVDNMGKFFPGVSFVFNLPPPRCRM